MSLRFYKQCKQVSLPAPSTSSLTYVCPDREGSCPRTLAHEIMARIFHDKAYARVASKVNGNLNLSHIRRVEHIDWISSLKQVVNEYFFIGLI